MIYLERAHKNIQDVFTQGWVDDDVYTRLVGIAANMPDVAVQCVGALVDSTTRPLRDAHALPYEFSLEEFIAIVMEKEPVSLLSRQEIESIISSKNVLINPDIKKRIIYTTYIALSRQETEIGSALVGQLEKITEGSLDFGEEKITLFYQKIFLLLVFRYAEYMPPYRMNGLFSSKLFSLALYMELPCIPALEVHIQFYTLVTIRQELSLDYAASIGSNNNILGVNEEKQVFSIREWVEYFNVKLSGVPREEYFQKVEDDPALLANVEEVRPLIVMCVYVYRLLISGYFILEPGSERIVNRLVQQIQKEEQQELLLQKEQAFPDEITQHTADMATWLHRTDALQSLLRWLQTFETKDAGRSAFVTLMQKTVPDISSDMDVAAALVEVDDFLQQNGYGSDDFIYFDEASGAFQYS